MQLVCKNEFPLQYFLFENAAQIVPLDIILLPKGVNVQAKEDVLSPYLNHLLLAAIARVLAECWPHVKAPPSVQCQNYMQNKTGACGGWIRWSFKKGKPTGGDCGGQRELERGLGICRTVKLCV